MPPLPKPVVMGLLQNQWFKDPERIPHIMKLYEEHKDTLDCPPRNRFIRDMLFLSCLSGRRIRQAFTWDVCADIIWEEVSPKISNNPSSCFPPDEQHILTALETIKPDIIITFGKVALEGIKLPGVLDYIEEIKQPVNLIVTCHPAARHAGVMEELKQAADKLQEWIQEYV